MQTFSGLTAAVAVLSATTAQAAAVSYCASGASDVCYQVGVPSSTASSGSGNIYFQLSAPTSYQWVALGTGSGMAGSNIFLVYQDGEGNLTVSSRHTSGHTEPRYDESAASDLELLSGSGVSGDTMVANVRCTNCEQYSGGTFDVSSTSSDWIAAWKEGPSLASTSLSESIDMHDANDQFTLDLSQASLSDDTNPFVGGSASSSPSGTSGPTGTSGTSGSSGSASSTGAAHSKAPPNKPLIWAHGLGMAIAFCILYPLGSAVMPLFGKWYIHGGWQMVTWILMWTCFGLGVYGAQQRHLLFNNVHTQLGTTVVCLLAIQPALGYLHHLYYLKYGKRGLVSHGHIWWGRIWMSLGCINGGLGLQMGNAKRRYVVAYTVVAAVMYLVYAVVKAFVSFRKSKSRRHSGNVGPKASAAGSGYVERGDEVPGNRYGGRQFIQHGK